MTIRYPSAKPRPSRRLTHGLAVGAAFALNGILYEVVPVAGALTVRVRAKVTAAASLDGVFVGPDFDQDQTVAFASLVGTQYSTGNPAQVALVANTENKMDLTVTGEGYAIIKLTGGASGAITFVDVSFLSNLR